MPLKHRVVACALSMLISMPLAALDMELIKQAQTSWDGETFNYPLGTPEVSILKARMAAGEQTAWHCHPVPVFGVVLQGELRVDTESGQSHVFKAGDPVVETMDSWHRGKAINGPVEFIVFMRARSAPKTLC